MSQENVELFRRGWRRRIDGDAGALLDVLHLEDIRPCRESAATRGWSRGGRSKPEAGPVRIHPKAPASDSDDDPCRVCGRREPLSFEHVPPAIRATLRQSGFTRSTPGWEQASIPCVAAATP